MNIRETTSHVEFEPSSYYAAFSCELEASAYPMWSIISHLKDNSYAELTKKIMTYLVNYLKEWLDAVNFYTPRIEKPAMMHASFHFPLHRYLAAFIYQAVKTMHISLNDILPEPETIKLLMMHPLRVQVSSVQLILLLLSLSLCNMIYVYELCIKLYFSSLFSYIKCTTFFFSQKNILWGRQNA